jgi:hypothetical protein
MDRQPHHLPSRLLQADRIMWTIARFVSIMSLKRPRSLVLLGEFLSQTYWLGQLFAKLS